MAKELKEMSLPEKMIMSQIINESPELEYPLKTLEMPEGFKNELEYDIPAEDKEKLWESLNPFMTSFTMDEILFDIHSGKRFALKDYKVIRSNERNFIVSPYYSEAGGTLLDFVPPTSDEPQMQQDDEN